MGRVSNALFHPGDFYLFWNVLVPLSVLLNIQHFGVRLHEIGLAILLSINPIVLPIIMSNAIFAWVVALFLIMWIQRVLRRWSWYRIYSFSFFKSALLFCVFIAIPSVILRFVWQPMINMLLGLLHSVLPDEPKEDVIQITDILVLIAAVCVLLHSFYWYSRAKCPWAGVKGAAGSSKSAHGVVSKPCGRRAKPKRSCR